MDKRSEKVRKVESILKSSLNDIRDELPQLKKEEIQSFINIYSNESEVFKEVLDKTLYLKTDGITNRFHQLSNLAVQDTWGVIFSFLRLKELCILSSVCKFFRVTITRHVSAVSNCFLHKILKKAPTKKREFFRTSKTFRELCIINPFLKLIKFRAKTIENILLPDYSFILFLNSLEGVTFIGVKEIVFKGGFFDSFQKLSMRESERNDQRNTVKNLESEKTMGELFNTNLGKLFPNLEKITVYNINRDYYNILFIILDANELKSLKSLVFKKENIRRHSEARDMIVRTRNFWYYIYDEDDNLRKFDEKIRRNLSLSCLVNLKVLSMGELDYKQVVDICNNVTALETLNFLIRGTPSNQMTEEEYELIILNNNQFEKSLKFVSMSFKNRRHTNLELVYTLGVFLNCQSIEKFKCHFSMSQKDIKKSKVGEKISELVYNNQMSLISFKSNFTYKVSFTKTIALLDNLKNLGVVILFNSKLFKALKDKPFKIRDSLTSLSLYSGKFDKTLGDLIYECFKNLRIMKLHVKSVLVDFSKFERLKVLLLHTSACHGEDCVISSKSLETLKIQCYVKVRRINIKCLNLLKLKLMMPGVNELIISDHKLVKLKFYGCAHHSIPKYTYHFDFSDSNHGKFELDSLMIKAPLREVRDINLEEVTPSSVLQISTGSFWRLSVSSAQIFNSLRTRLLNLTDLRISEDPHSQKLIQPSVFINGLVVCKSLISLRCFSLKFARLDEHEVNTAYIYLTPINKTRILKIYDCVNFPYRVVIKLFPKVEYFGLLDLQGFDNSSTIFWAELKSLELEFNLQRSFAYSQFLRHRGDKLLDLKVFCTGKNLNEKERAIFALRNLESLSISADVISLTLLQFSLPQLKTMRMIIDNRGYGFLKRELPRFPLLQEISLIEPKNDRNNFSNNNEPAEFIKFVTQVVTICREVAKLKDLKKIFFYYRPMYKLSEIYRVLKNNITDYDNYQFAFRRIERECLHYY